MTLLPVDCFPMYFIFLSHCKSWLHCFANACAASTDGAAWQCCHHSTQRIVASKIVSFLLTLTAQHSSILPSVAHWLGIEESVLVMPIATIVWTPLFAWFSTYCLKCITPDLFMVMVLAVFASTVAVLILYDYLVWQPQSMIWICLAKPQLSLLFSMTVQDCILKQQYHPKSSKRSAKQQNIYQQSRPIANKWGDNVAGGGGVCGSNANMGTTMTIPRQD